MVPSIWQEALALLDMEKETIGFVGLGLMGKPMAINLLKANYEVIANSRSIAPIDEVVALGAKRASSNDALATESTVVITMLPTPDVTRTVVLGAEGLLSKMTAGSLFIDMGTESPSLAQEIAKAAGKVGVEALDAPVSGGDIGAINGTLSIMVGGETRAFERAKEIFSVLGSSALHLGGPGSGQIVKASNQIMVAGILASISEGLALIEGCGIDMDQAIRALSGGRAGSALLSAKANQMLERSYAPGFKVDLHLKDLGIVAEYARQRGIAIPVTSLATQLLIAVEASGGGDLDHSAIIEAIRGLGHIDLGVKPTN